ncbi:MAG: alpha/beta hydrolase, partial [Candidatus Eremiobacterota bacterium]
GMLAQDGLLEFDDDVFVEFVEGVRKRLGYKRFSMVGFSTGGRVLLNYALAYPDFLDRVVLIDCAGMNEFSPLHTGPLAKVAPGLLRLAMSAPIYLNHLAVEHLVDQQGKVARWIQSWFPRSMSSSVVRYNYACLHSGMGTRLAVWRHKLPKLKLPALILWCSKDTLCPVEGAHELSALLAGSKVSILKGFHHYGLVEQPDFFVREMLPFLQEAAGRSERVSP